MKILYSISDFHSVSTFLNPVVTGDVTFSDNFNIMVSLISGCFVIVESTLLWAWSSDAPGNLGPDMWTSGFTVEHFLVNEPSSEESAVLSSFPHVDTSCFALSNLASWDGFSSKSHWVSSLLHDHEWSANLFADWW